MHGRELTGQASLMPGDKIDNISADLATSPRRVSEQNDTKARLCGCRLVGAIGTEPSATTRERGRATQPRVEQVPHGVAEHVETVNDNSQE